MVSSAPGTGSVDAGVIPEKLKEFLSRAPSSLLIKGASGTGKTSLALTILRVLDAREGFVYLSTRASPSQLFAFHPWLKKWLDTKSPKRPRRASEPGPPESFVDCRLDEPTQLFERITNQLMDSNSPTVVIDTWDSLKDFKEEDSLQSDLRVLLAWCERAKARLILVDENPEIDVFDAIVDGVVRLDQREVDGAMERTIALTKLRGTDLGNPTSAFTLADARFRVLKPRKVRTA